jgi:hypothetical protein
LENDPQPHDGRSSVGIPEGSRRLALVDKLAVDVVLHDDEVAFGGDRQELLPPRPGETHAGGVVKGRDGVQKTGAFAGGAQLLERRVQRAKPEALVVERYADDLDRVVAHDAERQVVSRRLDEHHVARRGEDREHLAERL